MKEDNSTLGLFCVRMTSDIQQCVFEVYTVSDDWLQSPRLVVVSCNLYVHIVPSSLHHNQKLDILYNLTLLLDAGIEASACARKSTTSTSTSTLLTFHCITGSLIVVWLFVCGIFEQEVAKSFYTVFNLSREAVLFLVRSLHGQRQAQQFECCYTRTRVV